MIKYFLRKLVWSVETEEGRLFILEFVIDLIVGAQVQGQKW